VAEGHCEAPCVKSRSQNSDLTSWKSHPKSFQVSVLETASVKIRIRLSRPIPTVRADSGGQLKRGTVASHRQTDAPSEFIYKMEAPSQFCFFLFLQWAILISPLEASENRSLLSEDIRPALQHTYITENRRILGKPYGIKVCCYWEHLGEHIQNLGTCVNIIGRCS